MRIAGEHKYGSKKQKTTAKLKMGRPRVLKDKKCQACGNLFRPSCAKVKSCSRNCSRINIPKKGKFLLCGNCGIETYKQKSLLGRPTFYCSKKCHLDFIKKNAFNFPCKICGKAIFTQPTQLKYRARSTCSLECMRKLARQRAEKRRIENGYTKHQLDRLARYSIEAEKWRKKVFERDNYTCQFCRTRGTYLEADHIKPWAYFPDLRFELYNGRTLCRKCHDKTKIGAKRMRELYEKK